MPTPGHFILHARAVPPLTAGDYVLAGNQQVAGGATEPYEGHVRVTSPRYRMPPDQILSSFPPANAEGAFESRLPQVVLRRRTLPWERAVDADRTIPWLALVVIAEGEGTLSAEVPVAECVTPGVTLPGPNDVATGVYLSVSQTFVNKVFPTKDDLALLAHVREVDLNDTELAMGDDDGFMAVVLANRLPQFDRQTCSPVRYLACLVNLEGQLDILPPKNQPLSETYFADAVVQDLRVAMGSGYANADTVVMGKGGVTVKPAFGISAARRALPPGPVSASQALGVSGAKGSSPSSKASQWSYSPQQIEAAAVSAAPSDAWRVSRDVMGAGFRIPVDHFVLEPVYRFPVLAYWSFTCTGAGSFETLMQGLDVGLLGTLPADPAARPRPDCLPAAKGSAPPPAPASRPDLEGTETGHVGLPYLTRRGENVRAWYRGPCMLNVTRRDAPDADGHLPLAHTSDQLRRLVPDGREDLSYAAAFEIGRLLALSQPAIVAALLQWRQEAFGAARAARLAALALADMPSLSVEGTLADLGHLVGKQFLLSAAKEMDTMLAPARPLADPGRPLPYAQGNLDAIIATGFGIDLGEVRKKAEQLGTVGALASVTVPQVQEDRIGPDSIDHLKAGLNEVVSRVAADALKQPTPPGGAARSRAERPDALDELLARAGRAAGEDEP